MSEIFSIKNKHEAVSWSKEIVTENLQKISQLDKKGKLNGKKVMVKKGLSLQLLGKVKQFFWSILSHTGWGLRLFGVDYAQNRAIFD
ncbi:hypothetical protein [Parachlamydia sp. AcF125]|uniref:hypothetical protein n=1 Tax=Parachlamydia sp. AcF125 TaxID=2795736 RepID=UPI001BC97947|nr:hypothetical protein [Parachlamydia sp. AcF125]MBS4168255.1 hypothetical protein [Parachlamydia sp. AcF125]